jgi:hypothetical protein
MFKPFFVHFNRPVTKADKGKIKHSPRGFTAYIQSSALERHVQVQVAWCSTLDEFVKKAGRKYAVDADIVAFNPRELPKLMAQCANTCWASDVYEESDYLYLLKYIV